MKFPSDDKYFKWTSHIKQKMVFYRLSPQIIKTILKNPMRREEGIAPQTIAIMKRNDTAKRKEEIWVMYRVSGEARNEQRAKSKEQRVKKSRSKKLNGIEVAFALRKLLVPEKRIMISAWRYPGITKPGDPIPIPEDIEMELFSSE